MSIRTAAVVIAALVALALASSVSAQPALSTTWAPLYHPEVVVRSGNVVYVGGDFDYVGPPTGGGAAVSPVSGRALASPGIIGRVSAAVSDGAGGWFIGGLFTQVGGVARSNLAHVLANGTVDAWNPGANGWVRALARSGNTLYVGGTFTTIAGQPRTRLAALNTVDATALAWNPGADGTVNAIAPRGGAIVVGGSFANAGGQARARLAEIQLDGSATAWNPAPDGSIVSLKAIGNSLYASGAFLNIAGQSRRGMARFDPAGVLTSWNPQTTFAPQTLDAGAGRVYVVKSIFPSSGGVACIDSANGNQILWDLTMLSAPKSLAFCDGRVYVDGGFSGVSPRVRALDASTGLATSWSSELKGNPVDVVVAEEGGVYIGGNLMSVGGVARRNLAAFDANTGALLDWSPVAGTNAGTDVVRAILVDGNTVYVGGHFASAGAQPRSCLAAFDASTGVVTSWAPNPDADVFSLVKSGDVIYAGGSFTNVGGQLRRSVAALSATTGLATSWDANCTGGTVRSLALDGSLLYVAGGFVGQIGGASRQGLAALDVSTALAGPWNPTPSQEVLAVLAHDGFVYVGGGFTSVGGATRFGIAQLSSSGVGAATPWALNTNFAASVYSLAVDGGRLYLGGGFDGMSQSARFNVAAFELNSGPLSSWAPNTFGIDGSQGTVYGIAASGGGVYFVGDFTTVAGTYRPGIAFFPPPGTVDASADFGVSSLALSPAVPNPVRASSVVRYHLAKDSNVSLALFDVRGRRVQTLVDGEWRSSGPHEATVEAAARAAGVYFLRLDVAGDSRIQKLVVLH